MLLHALFPNNPHAHDQCVRSHGVFQNLGCN